MKVQNLQEGSQDIFIDMIIGGFREDEVANPSGKREKQIVGERGPNFKTELLRGVEKEEVRPVKQRFDGEHHASYIMVQEEELQIEVWQFSKFKLNEFMGSFSMKLDEVASSHINHNHVIRKVSGDRKGN